MNILKNSYFAGIFKNPKLYKVNKTLNEHYINCFITFFLRINFPMRKLNFSEKCIVNGTGIVNHNLTATCIDSIQWILMCQTRFS